SGRKTAFSPTRAFAPYTRPKAVTCTQSNGTHTQSQPRLLTQKHSQNCGGVSLPSWKNRGAGSTKRLQRTSCRRLLLLASRSARGTKPLNRRPLDGEGSGARLPDHEVAGR